MGSSEKDNSVDPNFTVFYNDREALEKGATADSKLLAKAFIQFSKDGNLSPDEITALKALDKALKGANVEILTNDELIVYDESKKKLFLTLNDKLEKTNMQNLHKKSR